MIWSDLMERLYLIECFVQRLTIWINTESKHIFMVVGATAKKHLLGDKTIGFGFGPTRSCVRSTPPLEPFIEAVPADGGEGP